jgi:DNA helicase-2/ATP-dependent DNA helicase PcrA
LDVANAVSARLASDPESAALTLVSDPERGAGTVEVRDFADQGQELDSLVEWVQDRHDRSAEPSWAHIAVLARKNADVGLAYRALSLAGIPAEVVGLGGLLSVPEVSDVVATLRLLIDLQDNPAVVQLLSGPRWRLGPADLAALSRRAVALARQSDASSRGSDAGDAVGVGAGAGVGDDAAAGDGARASLTPGGTDSERAFPVLLEAIGNLGRVHVSEVAAARMRAFAAELAQLRTHVHEPVPALLHRVLDVAGLLGELALREKLGEEGDAQLRRFVQRVSDFVADQGQVSLRAVLAWLDAEASQASELEQATPTAADSVKLLTVHRAKGLEWDHVAVMGLTVGVFPHDKVEDKWTSKASALPASLRGDAGRVPQLAAIDSASLKTYESQLQDRQAFAEDRLGYVAVSRARESLLLSSAHWRGTWKNPQGPSRVFLAGCGLLESWGEPASLLSDEQVGNVNPLVAEPREVPWPQPLDPDFEARLSWSAASVRDGLVAGAGDELGVHELALVNRWDSDTRRLIQEEQVRHGAVVRVAVPPSLSASALLQASKDLPSFQAGLARPMPRPVSGSAVLGTRFHEWVQHRFEGVPTLPGMEDELGFSRAEAGDEGSGLGWIAGENAVPTSDDEALAQLCLAFESGPFAWRLPLAVEVPFVLKVGKQQIRGRLDIVYKAEDAPYRFQIIDWKTGVSDKLDPNQLAIYRLAWAQASGCTVGEIDAAFYVVPTGELIRPHDLLSADGVEALVERLRRNERPEECRPT